MVKNYNYQFYYTTNNGEIHSTTIKSSYEPIKKEIDPEILAELLKRYEDGVEKKRLMKDYNLSFFKINKLLVTAYGTYKRFPL